MRENYLGATKLNKTSSYLVRSNNRRDPKAEIVWNPRVKVVTGLHYVKKIKIYTTHEFIEFRESTSSKQHLKKCCYLKTVTVQGKGIEEDKTKVFFLRGDWF
jgi:hypothetical protein